jgi:hypothetical protein
MKKIKNSDLINKFIEKHGDRFDYSMVNHVNSLTPVKIKCIKHDVIFEQLPHNHLAGKVGCMLCMKQSMSRCNVLLESDFIYRCILFI